VFCTTIGTALNAANVRSGFRSVVDASGIGGNWTLRELRHSFVPQLSANGVPVEAIARLVGHAGTAATEAVYARNCARCSPRAPR
jgi:site-specific recombinase XerD